MDCTTLRVLPEASAGTRLRAAIPAPAYGIPRPAVLAQPVNRLARPAVRPTTPPLEPAAGTPVVRRPPPPFCAGLPSGPRMGPLPPVPPPPGMEDTIRVPTRIVATAPTFPGPPPGPLGTLLLLPPRHHVTPRPIQRAAVTVPAAATSAPTPNSIFGRWVTRAIVAGRQNPIRRLPRSRCAMSCANAIAALGSSDSRCHLPSRPR